MGDQRSVCNQIFEVQKYSLLICKFSKVENKLQMIVLYIYINM